MFSVSQIARTLSGKRFPLEDEKATQAAVEAVLYKEFSPWVERECRLPGFGTIDFMVREIGVEVKIKGQEAAIVRQLRRYANSHEIQGLILLTSKPVGLPPLIRGKPLAVVDMGRAWL